MRNLVIILLFIFSCQVRSQDVSYYNEAFNVISNMLSNDSALNFKKAVYLVENAYFDGKLDESGFNSALKSYASLCQSIAKEDLIMYTERDYKSVNMHAALFKLMTDTLSLFVDNSKLVQHLPFQYNFDDYAGEKDWSSMFVSTLLATHKGNCHSLPILYKLIAEEMGEKAWLSIAPNHFYIKIRSGEHGWYNTELTSGQFPTDAWIKASGYVHIDAIKNGLYMDTLSLKKSVAVCMIDLAQGYQRKHPSTYSPEFVIECCNHALKAYPNYINGLLLKTETLYNIYQRSPDKPTKEYDEITQLLEHVHQLGYRKMPEEMYLKWLFSFQEPNQFYRKTPFIPTKN